MRGHIQTVLAKIDDPLSFKFMHTNIADKKKVDKYNAKGNRLRQRQLGL